MGVQDKLCFKQSIFIGGVVSIIIFTVITISIIILGLLYYKSSSVPVVPINPVIISETRYPPQQVRNSDARYPTGSYVSKDNNFDNFINVGYIFNSDGRFPLYMNRLGGRFYYFTRDDSRNNIKITIGNQEFGLKDEYSDGDTIVIPELSLSPFSVKIYENRENIYRPFPVIF